MKVLNIEAHNVLRVSDIRFDLEGHHLFLVGGKNAQGKSSAINALRMALCGKRGMDYPDMPLKEGQRKGWVRVNLSGDAEFHEDERLTVELLLRRRRNGTVAEELRILESTGELAPEPRKTLDRVLKVRGYDPLAFERMKPAEQRDKVQEMLGVDLSAFDARRREAYEERTSIGREAKRLAARAEGMPKHTGVPGEEVSVAELIGELDAAKATNERSASMKRDVAALIESQARIADANAERKAEILRLEEKIKELKATIENSEVSTKEAKEREVELQRQLETGDCQPVDEAKIRERMRNAEEVNAKVRENKARVSAMKEAAESHAKYDSLTNQIQRIDEEKADAIASAEWPVEGMELTEDGLLLNGLPFEQASKAERIIASTKIGMAMNPKLRLLVCQDGNDLDNESLDALQKVLEEHDFQMVVELVTRSQEDMDRCAVVISDGSVVGKDCYDEPGCDSGELQGTGDGDGVGAATSEAESRLRTDD